MIGDTNYYDDGAERESDENAIEMERMIIEEIDNFIDRIMQSRQARDQVKEEEGN